MSKKKNKRIRQTKTSWQKTFEDRPDMIQSLSWFDRLPEFIHISIALNENDYTIVERDFFKIADFVNFEKKIDKQFIFTLSQTIDLIKCNEGILELIKETCFNKAFEHLLFFYSELFEIDFNENLNFQFPLLLKGFSEILEGKSDTSTVLKYILIKYKHNGQEDRLNIFDLKTKKEILSPINVTRIRSLFLASISDTDLINLQFSEEIWLFNYTNSPLLPRPDDSEKEKETFIEVDIPQLRNEFIELYSDFKKINLLGIYSTYIAEVNMGLVARICDLTIDVIDLVENHKGEIAELVYRTSLETFIIISWLLKRQDVELYKRFRDYSIGRQKFMGNKVKKKTNNKKIIEQADKLISDAINEAGVLDIDVAEERGDIFNVRIDQMADEVWGKDNTYYFLYKRTSEVVHGQWKVIAKYHLEKSYNPMHNGLYWYSENSNKFAGLIPVFSCLTIASEILNTIMLDIDVPETKDLKEKLEIFHKKQSERWMTYYNEYIK